MLDFQTTRFSNTAGLSLSNATAPCLLVRVYPVNGFEPPYELSDQPLLVGRDGQCSLQLEDDSVSRRHALIEPCGEKFLVSDLGSTNGTYVNDSRVLEPFELAAGDRVRFGNQIFKYLGADGIESQYHEVIFKMMTTDGLTAVHNKRYLLEALDRDLSQAQRFASPLCVMMLDLDKFKSVNDTYGHLAGDAVLVEFARRAKSVLRSGELLARYGGEEFAMLLTRTSIDEAIQVAERIREITAATPVVFDSVLIPITVSIGIAGITGYADVTAEDLFAAADKHLYAAKHSGRNKVVYLLGESL